jgi:collagen type V/XI/XXIV/XXVII alpha
VAQIGAPGGVAQIGAPGGVAQIGAPGGVAQIGAPAGVAQIGAPGGVAQIGAPGGVAQIGAPGGRALPLQPGIAQNSAFDGQGWPRKVGGATSDGPQGPALECRLRSRSPVAQRKMTYVRT